MECQRSLKEKDQNNQYEDYFNVNTIHEKITRFGLAESSAVQV